MFLSLETFLLLHLTPSLPLDQLLPLFLSPSLAPSPILLDQLLPLFLSPSLAPSPLLLCLPPPGCPSSFLLLGCSSLFSSLTLGLPPPPSGLPLSSASLLSSLSITYPFFLPSLLSLLARLPPLPPLSAPPYPLSPWGSSPLFLMATPRSPTSCHNAHTTPFYGAASSNEDEGDSQGSAPSIHFGPLNQAEGNDSFKAAHYFSNADREAMLEERQKNANLLTFIHHMGHSLTDVHAFL